VHGFADRVLNRSVWLLTPVRRLFGRDRVTDSGGSGKPLMNEAVRADSDALQGLCRRGRGPQRRPGTGSPLVRVANSVVEPGYSRLPLGGSRPPSGLRSV